MTRKRIILKNAGANVLSGGAGAILAVALPPFLVRLLPPPVFGAWALILDLAALANLFRYGLQTAVGKYIAEAHELAQAERCDEVVNTAIALMAGLGVLAFLVVVVVVLQFGRWFHQVPAALQPDARVALLWVGATLALGLPFCVFNGIFTGLQRFEFPAAINGVSKLVLAAVLILIARAPHPSLEKLALGWAVVMVSSYGVQLGLCRWLGPRIRYSWRAVGWPMVRELSVYSASLTVWSVGMLMIAGLDTTLVGALDFAAVGYYALAAALVALLAGLQNAIFGALVPVGSVLNVSDDSKRRLGDLLIDSTRYGCLVLLVSGLPLLLIPGPLLRVWIGVSYAAPTATLVRWLVFANILRLTATPYSALLVGTGQQILVLISPILEGSVNLVSSIWLGYRMGAVGVALGTLIGASVGLSCHLFYNIPRTPFASLRLREYFRQGIARPLLGGIPACCLYAAYWAIPQPARPPDWAAVTLLAVSTAAGAWLIGLSTAERSYFVARMLPALGRASQ